MLCFQWIHENFTPENEGVSIRIRGDDGSSFDQLFARIFAENPRPGLIDTCCSYITFCFIISVILIIAWYCFKWFI
jgi:hypothetical protein